MFVLNAQIAALPIVASAILFVFVLIIVAYYNHFDLEDLPFMRRYEEPRLSPRRKRQSRDETKRIAVEKDGELKFYRINQYGEIFED